MGVWFKYDFLSISLMWSDSSNTNTFYIISKGCILEQDLI